MHIIIDGYNVLKLALKKDFVTDTERTHFIRRLAHYARRKKHTLTIVFDGGSAPRPYTEKDHGVTVIYSGDYMSADEYIADYLQAERSLDPLLITSDNGLRKVAFMNGLDALASDDFYRLVMYELGNQTELLTQDGVIHTMTDTKDTDVATLMEEASCNITHKEGDIPRQYVRLVKSKIGKRLAKKITTL